MTEHDPTRLGTILGVWAHPDDEAYLSATIMATAIGAGQRVVCITATRGEAGSLDHERWPPETMAAVREAELDACLAVLGVTEHTWLDYPDGGCGEVPVDEPAARIAAVVDDVRPDTVLTFGPDGMTGHVDHIAVCQWTTEALRRSNYDGGRLFYATKTPEWNAAMVAVIDPDHVMMGNDELPATDLADLSLHVRAEGADLDRKVKAMLCQESQVGPLIAQSSIEGFIALMADEFFRDP